jgi:hypothetical protein
MAEATLEERVATLEQLVAHLLRTTAPGERPKDWHRTVGMFDGDPIMQEIIVEGRRLRDEDRRQTRP